MSIAHYGQDYLDSTSVEYTKPAYECDTADYACILVKAAQLGMHATVALTIIRATDIGRPIPQVVIAEALKASKTAPNGPFKLVEEAIKKLQHNGLRAV